MISYRERDFLAAGLLDPSLGEALRDLLLFERDFSEALLPLLDLAFSDGLFDFTDSLDLERLRDALAGDCGEGDWTCASTSPVASDSEEFSM